ncbi:MAG TPA: hypothetical protein PLP11_02890 [Bacteroidales bacterium]|nr:hypothetical protein [Bacteroidales bacterium]
MSASFYLPSLRGLKTRSNLYFDGWCCCSFVDEDCFTAFAMTFESPSRLKTRSNLYFDGLSTGTSTGKIYCKKD